MNQEDFEKYLVSEYFKYGSINKVFSAHSYDLPISFAGYTRVLSKYKVVKSAGPNSNLSESLHILSKLANYKIPLERIYHQHAPKKIQVSTNTLHRILHYTRLGLTRRQGTALIITQKNKPGYFLMGNDQTISDPALGHKGDLSLPMGHSKINENPKDSILRVLQQEVFTNLVLKNNFPEKILPEHPNPVMFINIADIKVAVFHLELSGNYSFSSFKLNNLKFYDSNNLHRLKIRPGVEEMLNGFLNQSITNTSKVPIITSNLNRTLYVVAKVPVQG